MWFALALLITVWATERDIPLDLIALLVLLYLLSFFAPLFE